MNGYERICAALKGEKPDKTPIMLHNFMLAAREHGISMEQYRNSPKAIAETFIAAMDKYQYDGILVDIDTVTLAGAVGVPVDFPVNDPARSHIGNLANLEDVVHLKPVRVEDYRYIQIWLEAVRLLKTYYKDEIHIRGNCDQSPFSLASMMRGPQNWMLDLMMGSEGQIDALLEYCTDAGSQFIKLMAQTGCDMVSNGDSPAGPEMISPEMYLKYAMPYEKRIVEVAHNAGIAYTLHICGNTDVILEYMLLTGADAFELDYKTDIGRIYHTLHNTNTFIGNIDPSGVLAMGTEDLVRIKTMELLSVYKGSNRFILNAGCAIPPTTPSGNLKMMIETARNFG
ncbi:MAG: uroporphyrinogen decarboxylase family protein [Prolixibacteraceae bacterium]|jgi:uroporphyrinogen decarboxylase|nr:uroporphyrinogen decarboxylase family protein [Prolixibacteraceae bacterium]